MKDFLDRLRKSGYIPLAVIAAVSAIFVFILYSDYTENRREVERAYSAERLATAMHTATQVRQFLEGERDNLAGFAAALSLSGNINSGKALAEAQFGSGRRKRKQVTFFVMDDDGRFMYSAPESLIDRRMQDLSSEDYFVDPVKNRGFFMSPARPDRKDGWEVVLSMPVYSGGGTDGSLLGVAAERVDVRALEDVLNGGRDGGPEDGPAGYPVLVDDSGRVLAGNRSGMLYQVENSSPVLQKMIGGEAGSLQVDTNRDGLELVAFAPVVFEGRVWSVGIIYPSRVSSSGSGKGRALALLMAGTLALAFIWSLVSLVRAARGSRAVRELDRMTESARSRIREIASLDELTKSLGSREDAEGMLRSAVAIIKTDTGATGVAVRISGNGSGFALSAQSGMPEGFVDAEKCPEPGGCYCAGVMAGGVPVLLGEGRTGVTERVACHGGITDGLALVPLAAKGRPLGMLYVSGFRDGAGEDRMKFLAAAAAQIAAWYDNLQRIEDANRDAAMGGALFNTAQALTRSLDLDELLNIIITEAASLLKVRRCVLLLYNEERNRVDCRMALGYDCGPDGQAAFNPSGVFWEAMEDGGVKVVDMRERKHDVPTEFTARFGMDTFILVTLTSKGRVLGFLVLDADGRKAAPDELRLIMGFANQAALAIETSSYYIRTVERYNEDLQRLSGRIIEAQEEERKRISRDLHDELGQVLTAVKINLDLVSERLKTDPRQAAERVADAIGLTASALDGVRRLSFELRPPMLDDLGLGTVIGKLIADFRKRSGMDVEFSEEGPDDRLPPGMEVTLYRVVQEALTNIMRHSKASRVSVRLSRNPGKGVVSMYIEDDGAGFDPEATREGQDGGFGLMGIKERVALLGGNFRIFSGEGKGTRVLVDIPMNRAGVS